jgi:hypothetical protein
MMKMEREQQILEALRVIRPRDRDRCRADVERTLDAIDEETAVEKEPSLAVSKAAKAKARVIYKALRNIERTGVTVISDLQKHIDVYDAILKQPSKRLKRPAVRQLLAAVGAQSLLLDYDGNLSATRSGQWDKLAALLYGEPSANMFRYLRELRDLNDIL